MNRQSVLLKLEELRLLYEGGILSHPFWYIPPEKRYLIKTHDELFLGKACLKLTIEEVAALLLIHHLIFIEEKE